MRIETFLEHLMHQLPPPLFQKLAAHPSLALVSALILNLIMGPPSADIELQDLDLQRFLCKGDYVVEVGANKGGGTRLISSMVGETGHIWSLEPNPLSYAVARVNLRGRQNVTLLAAGASSHIGEALLNLGGPTDSGASFVGVRGRRRFAVKIDLLPLDGLFNSNVARNLDALFIDCEGAELEVLKGAVGMLTSNDHLKIFIEVHLQAIPEAMRALHDFLIPYGYILFESHQIQEETVTCVFIRTTKSRISEHDGRRFMKYKTTN